MKYILLILFSCSWFALCGQSIIQPKYLQVTSNKTTNLIFPAQISSVDRGSECIVVQKSTGNILRVKADSLFKDTTNLTIITTDGRLYSFLVSYSASPAFLNIDMGAAENTIQDTSMLSFAQRVKRSVNYLHGIRYGAGKVWLSLLGVYSNGQIIACKLKIENSSPLSFEFGRIGAAVGAARKGRRRAAQEIELPILLIDSETSLVRERQAGVAVILLPKTGLAPGQALQIYVREKAGERHLRLILSNRYLLNAFLIP